MAQQRKRRWWALWGGKKKLPDVEAPSTDEMPPVAESAAAMAAAPPPGRAAEEVSEAFDDLMGRYEALLGQPQGTAESIAAVHKLFTEAEREAANIKARAHRQAEVEAAPLLAEAKRQAQETIGQASSQAQRITQEEAESILRDAHYKANLIEERAKQAAQIFLMRCREDVQSLVVLEAKEAFYKLLAPVNEVLSTAQEVEHALKMRAVDLWENASAQLGGYPSDLLGSLGPGGPAPAVQHIAAAGEDASQRAEDPPPVDDVPTDEPAAAASVASPPAAAEAPSPPAMERVEPAAVIEVSPEAGVRPEVPSAEEPEQPVETPTARVAAEAPPVSRTEAEQEPEQEPEQEKPESKTQAAPGPAAPGSYTGDLELLIEPYTNVAEISKLYRDLGAIDGIRVLRTSGAWDRGTVITVELSRPITLDFLGQRLPDVEASPAPAGGESWWKAAVGRKRQGTSAHGAVAIAFKSSQIARGDDSQDDGHDAEGAPIAPDGAEEKDA